MATLNKRTALVCARPAVCIVLVAVAAQAQALSFIARREAISMETGDWIWWWGNQSSVSVSVLINNSGP